MHAATAPTESDTPRMPSPLGELLVCVSFRQPEARLYRFGFPPGFVHSSAGRLSQRGSCSQDRRVQPKQAVRAVLSW